MPRVMTTPTKQELRDTIKAQQETIEYLEGQLADNESLRDELAKKAGQLSEQVAESKSDESFYESYYNDTVQNRFNAHCVHSLVNQLSVEDLAEIITRFEDRIVFAVSFTPKESDEPVTGWFSDDPVQLGLNKLRLCVDLA